MKKAIFFVAALLAFASIASAGEYVNGYLRKDGTYVQPHYRSSPDGNSWNNYSSQGNTNPYTGKKGYESNEYSRSPAYNSNPYGRTYRYGR